jgi:HD-GYP domain-containing protein (c-di-GMP phosphodiesterase class II)
LREWFGLGISPRVQPKLLGWVFLVDLLLTPVGLLTAFAAEDAAPSVLAVLPLVALLAIFARERRQRLTGALELSRAYRGTTQLLSDVLEADDEYTGVHSRDVVSLALATADELGLDPAQRRNVEFGALLHDLGKIAIPTELINKPGPLDDDEWVVVKTHTLEGQRMLDRVGGVLSEVGRVVRSSHERWDGKGYPDGLAGDEIPLESAIVACCDAFNAMTTDRSYRRARPPEQALEEVLRNAGTQFHPRVALVMARVVERDIGVRSERLGPPSRSTDLIGAGT